MRSGRRRRSILEDNVESERMQPSREFLESLPLSSGSGGLPSGSGNREDELHQSEKQEQYRQNLVSSSNKKRKELEKEDEDEAIKEDSRDTSKRGACQDNNKGKAVADQQPQQQERELLQPPNGGGTLQEEPEEDICTICLEEGNLRGYLDCCNHFFCFECIMEWSKKESRCPLCRKRFVALIRPVVSGDQSQSQIFEIPIRNQVYELPGEFPYENTVCAVCHQGGHEECLLLCNSCNHGAAHTYCVGLGRSVPLGNWFCSTCERQDDNPAATQTTQDPTQRFLHALQTPLEIMILREVLRPPLRGVHSATTVSTLRIKYLIVAILLETIQRHEHSLSERFRLDPEIPPISVHRHQPREVQSRADNSSVESSPLEPVAPRGSSMREAPILPPRYGTAEGLVSANGNTGQTSRPGSGATEGPSSARQGRGFRSSRSRRTQFEFYSLHLRHPSP